MRKKVILSIIALALLACVLCTLFACESYDADPLKKVGDKNAVVESNGGLMVRQGKYLYFVNGYSGYLTEKGKQNWFGNVTKGAIVRVTYNEDGSLDDDYTVVVPKSVMADSVNVGFSIFGNWIYYVSPSPEENRAGEVQTDTLQFLRTKLDGTGTQLILNWKGTSVQYKYTAKALVLFDSSKGKLYTKNLSQKKFNEDNAGGVIDSDVASVHFIKSETYDPKGSGSVADYILYTKNAKEDFEFSNTLYVTDSRGSKGSKKVLIGGDSYGDKKYNISILASKVTDEKLAIYYTKTSYVGTNSTGTLEGTFAYQFQDKSLNFVAADEKKLSSESIDSIYPLDYADGIVKTGSNAKIYRLNGEVESFGDLDLSTLLTVQNDCFYFLNSDGILLYYPLDKKSNVHYAYRTGEKFMTSFTGAEYYDEYFYFILDDEYDYMARIKLADIDIYSGKDATIEPVRKVTKSDKAKMDAEAEESESEK